MLLTNKELTLVTGIRRKEHSNGRTYISLQTVSGGYSQLIPLDERVYAPEAQGEWEAAIPVGIPVVLTLNYRTGVKDGRGWTMLMASGVEPADTLKAVPDADVAQAA